MKNRKNRTDAVQSGTQLQVVCTTTVWEERAQAFAEAMQVSYLSLFSEQDITDKTNADYVFCYSADNARLYTRDKTLGNPIEANFVTGKSAHRRQFGGGAGQMIAKAVGVKPGIRPDILDATAGLGRDAFVLACLGCRVRMIERSPVVSELLAVGLAQANQSEDPELLAIMARMSLEHIDAAQWLDRGVDQVPVVYLDPMFPHRDKSALVKKEMRAFRDLVGEDPDAEALLEPALSCAEYRVVVKRPRKAPTLSARKPTVVMSGKSSRYDIYTKKSLDYLKIEEA